MQYRKYTKEDKSQARLLFLEGKNKSEISRIMNIPRGTIKTWILNKESLNPRDSYRPIIFNKE